MSLVHRFDEYYQPGQVYEDTGLTVSEQLYTIRGSQSEACADAPLRTPSPHTAHTYSPLALPHRVARTGAIISSSYELDLGVTMGDTFLMRQKQEVATASGPADTDGVFGGNDNTDTSVTFRPLKAGALLDAAPVFAFSS